ncbi:hypothetical protein [Ligilactobacillus cholophilus]|uniref:hypothetical protein n=1 Tax=Ligilactobacillus cholophilus TaxID=3050131 RepID=UPI0025B1453E|nr:hypothetical protein [Ligilactobacillus cholophilus]
MWEKKELSNKQIKAKIEEDKDLQEYLKKDMDFGIFYYMLLDDTYTEQGIKTMTNQKKEQYMQDTYLANKLDSLLFWTTTISLLISTALTFWVNNVWLVLSPLFVNGFIALGIAITLIVRGFKHGNKFDLVNMVFPKWHNKDK